jgi:hypothetical protein
VKGRDHQGDLDIVSINEEYRGIGYGHVGWIHMGRNHWWALVNAVLNIEVPCKAGVFLSILWPR